MAIATHFCFGGAHQVALCAGLERVGEGRVWTLLQLCEENPRRPHAQLAKLADLTNGISRTLFASVGRVGFRARPIRSKHAGSIPAFFSRC